MYDAIIVGSGPAGYTAGIYLSRAGLKNRLSTFRLTVSLWPLVISQTPIFLMEN